MEHPPGPLRKGDDKNQKSIMRGLRNNNPLNIRHSSSCWKGMTKEQTDASFVTFESLAYGYRAAWRTLFTYFYRFVSEKKHFTVRNIISRWAPPTENNTEAYIRSVLQLSGIGGQERLLPPDNVQSYSKLSRLIAAMTVIENGIRKEAVDNQAIGEGYKLAFPEQATELEEWLQEEDEYKEW